MVNSAKNHVLVVVSFLELGEFYRYLSNVNMDG